MRATVSILGLNEYTDGGVWSELVVPQGVNSDLVKKTIMLECSELELLYGDPDIMKAMIGVWSSAELEIWRKLYATTTLEYNPIWNKDGLVTEHESRNRLTSGEGKDDETFRSEGSSSRSQNDEASQTGQVSAYDATTFQNRDKTETDASSTEHVVADNENRTERADVRDTYEGDDRSYERRETGNIGVTTTQQMIKEEREVDQFNIIDYIVQSFKRRFCLCIY